MDLLGGESIGDDHAPHQRKELKRRRSSKAVENDERADDPICNRYREAQHKVHGNADGAREE